MNTLMKLSVLLSAMESQPKTVLGGWNWELLAQDIRDIIVEIEEIQNNFDIIYIALKNLYNVQSMSEVWRNNNRQEYLDILAKAEFALNMNKKQI